MPDLRYEGVTLVVRTGSTSGPRLVVDDHSITVLCTSATIWKGCPSKQATTETGRIYIKIRTRTFAELTFHRRFCIGPVFQITSIVRRSSGHVLVQVENEIVVFECSIDDIHTISNHLISQVTFAIGITNYVEICESNKFGLMQKKVTQFEVSV